MTADVFVSHLECLNLPDIWIFSELILIIDITHALRTPKFDELDRFSMDTKCEHILGFEKKKINTYSDFNKICLT